MKAAKTIRKADMTKQLRFHLNRLADKLVTVERFGKTCPYGQNDTCPALGQPIGLGLHADCCQREAQEATTVQRARIYTVKSAPALKLDWTPADHDATNWFLGTNVVDLRADR